MFIRYNTKLNKKNIKEVEKTLNDKYPYLLINLNYINSWYIEEVLEVKIKIPRYNIKLNYAIDGNIKYYELINNIKVMCWDRIIDEIGLGE